jgi:hypothetical protein
LPLQLVWTAPAGCPSAAEVRAELTRIARVRSGASLRPLSAEARVSRIRGGYRLVLQTEHEGRRGLRTLEASDCQTLSRSATLVLALAFGPALELAVSESPLVAAGTDRALQGLSASASPEPSATSASKREESSAGARADGAARSSSARAYEADAWSPGFGLFVQGFGVVGLLPKAALGAAAGLRLTLGAYAIDIRAAVVPGGSEQLRAMIRADYRALGGSLSACRLAPIAELFELAGCAGVRVLSISARTSGALERGAATAPWTAVTAGAAIAWPRSYWLQVRAELSIAVSVSRPRFVVERLGDTQRVALVLPELGISVAVGL